MVVSLLIACMVAWSISSCVRAVGSVDVKFSDSAMIVFAIVCANACVGFRGSSVCFCSFGIGISIGCSSVRSFICILPMSLIILASMKWTVSVLYIFHVWCCGMFPHRMLYPNAPLYGMCNLDTYRIQMLVSLVVSTFSHLLLVLCKFGPGFWLLYLRC